jgi:branched-chain amino acid transport system substrate-binding protein
VRFAIALMLVCAAVGSGADRAGAQVSDGIVRIGVLNDQSGLYADLGGPGSVIAAKMAVEDVGGSVLGKPVDVIFADHQNKADIGAAIARQWFDAEKVDLAIGFDNSAVALAVEQLAAEHNRIAIAGAVGSTAFTGKSCTPTEASWIYDSYALTTSLARSVVAEGRDSCRKPTPQARCALPAAKCSAASAIPSTHPTSVPISFRRKAPAPRWSRLLMAAAT